MTAENTGVALLQLMESRDLSLLLTLDALLQEGSVTLAAQRLGRHLEHMTLLWVRMVRVTGAAPHMVWAALSR